MKNLHKVSVVLSVLSVFISVEYSHSVDANFNSQLTNIRSAASGVPTDPTLGFDPCKGGTNAGGICNAATGPLLSINNVGSSVAVGVFSKLGPGAVTDNMFGTISSKALGATSGLGDDTETTNCAPGTGTTNFDVSINGGLNGLNCGSIRINAAQQGQVFPSGVNSLGLEGSGTVNTVTKNMSFTDDTCGLGSTGCPLSSHVGFDLINNFTFTMNKDGAGVATPSDATTTSAQMIRQVTAVNPGAPIGTLTTPGGGDQLFEVSTSFTAAFSPDTANGDPASDKGPDLILGTADDINIVVTWSQTIEDPDQSGTSGAKFEQTLSGSFTRDAQFGAQKQFFECPIGSTATTVNICAQYPTGLSQTTGEISGATLP